MSDELERPPSLWPWIIGGLLALFVLGAVIGSILHALFELLIIVAVIALIVWGVMRLVGVTKR